MPTDPNADGWVIVTDNSNTHMSETLMKFIAEQCGIKGDLGVKGKCGVLKSLETRKAFLEDKSHRIRFVYTPKHCSWLNRFEIWFSGLNRRVLARGNFRSLDELKEKIIKYIEFYNKTAKPMKWKFRPESKNSVNSKCN